MRLRSATQLQQILLLRLTLIARATAATARTPGALAGKQVAAGSYHKPNRGSKDDGGNDHVLDC